MRIKKYTASSMKEALLLIKQDLGENAMILKTRKLPKKLFSLSEKSGIEVTAAIDDTIDTKDIPLTPLKISRPEIYSRPLSKRKPPPAKPELPVQYTEKTENKTTEAVQKTEHKAMTERFHFLELREDIQEMKGLLKSILATGETSAAGGFSGEWAVLYKRLTDSEIRHEIAEDIIKRLKEIANASDKNIDKKFLSVLGENFPVAGPINQKEKNPQVAAFVGPTGSGKTTTIAKLAAYYSIHKSSHVSIITADTYRIAAIEQIRAFAEIVNIALHVVFSPDEVEDVIVSCENDDIVFIDTAGRSQRNIGHMRELEEFLDMLKPDETHLVLSATTKNSDLSDIVKRYKDLKVNRLLFTKLDETAFLGNIFNTVSKYGIPVSYLTSGQCVPDDIELAQPGRFVQRLLEGSSL